LASGPAVLGGEEELADQLLHALPGPHLDQQPDLLGGGVPEVVGHAGPDLDPGPGVGLQLAAGVAHRQPAPDHREGLGGDGVDVLPGHRPAGAQVQVDDQQVAVGLLGRDAHDPAFPGDRVLVQR
jgi:hypothetical protein